MKLLAVIFLLLNILSSVSCQEKIDNKIENKSQVQPTDNLETKALAKIFDSIKNQKIEGAELKADEIVIGKTKIKVTAATEHDMSNQGGWIYAARFETKLFALQENVFTVGSIGIGKDRNDALQTAIDEWAAFFVTAFSEMLANQTGSEIAGFRIYPGLLGIRGEKPTPSWIDGSAEMNKKIINALMPVIKKSDREINSLNLMLSVTPNGDVDGECRINNEVSQEILAELKKLNWDKSQTGYLFKQFYLLRKNSDKKELTGMRIKTFQSS